MNQIITPAEAYRMAQAPGFTLEQFKTVYVSPHFSWAEVFTNRLSGHVRGAHISIYHNALKQSRLLERIRAYLRQHLSPTAVMKVTSWWRSASANARIRGASRTSRHLLALGTDFFVPGFESVQGNQRVQALLLDLMRQTTFSLEITRGQWTHVDDRAGVVFENMGGGHYPVRDRAWQDRFAEAHRGTR